MPVFLFLVIFPVVYMFAAFATFAALDFAGIALIGEGLFKTLWTLVKSSNKFDLMIGAPWQIQLRLIFPAILSLPVAGFFAYGFAKQEKENREGKIVHLRGRQYIKNVKQAAKYFGEENGKMDGLKINPSLPALKYGKEGEHFMVVGGVGSGKTQTLVPWLWAAIARGDACIVHDVKGDFTSFVPQPMILLAAWDKRGYVWDVARDVLNKAHARELAEGLIKESQGSPMFSNAARQVLVGCVVYLQHTKPREWGFADLAVMCAQDQPTLLNIMTAFNPEAIRAVKDENVTTAGILINLAAYLAPVYDLATAWPVVTKSTRKISIRNYLNGLVKTKDGKTPVLILQNNKAMESLAQGLHASILRIAAQYICSPEMLEDRSKKIWFFIDEFPQLGKIESIGSMLDIGRSKGVRVVLLAQSLEQIKNKYGQELAKSWAALVGSMIIARSQNETARAICDNAIGKREIERHTVSYSKNVGSGGNGVNRSNSVQVQTVDVVMPSELLADIGPSEEAGGVHILWLTGRYALRLLIPFTTPKILRPQSTPAGWAAGDDPASDAAIAARIKHFNELNAATIAAAAEKVAKAAEKAKKAGGGAEAARQADPDAAAANPAQQPAEPVATASPDENPGLPANPAQPSNSRDSHEKPKLAEGAGDVVADALMAALTE